MGICVQEFRNGVFLSETRRDFGIVSVGLHEMSNMLQLLNSTATRYVYRPVRRFRE